MNKIQLIKETFDKINELTGGKFVVIRNYNEIPDNSSIDNDIDILIPKDFDKKITEYYFGKQNFYVYKDNNSCLYGAKNHLHLKNKELNVHFDVVDGLYYRSLNNINLFIKINDILSESMVRNRIRVPNVIWKYKPNYEDELCHLCCHTIFDKREVSDKYAEQMEFLFKKANKFKLKFLLEKAFFKAHEIIYSSLKQGDFKKIYENYITYKDY